MAFVNVFTHTPSISRSKLRGIGPEGIKRIPSSNQIMHFSGKFKRPSFIFFKVDTKYLPESQAPSNLEPSPEKEKQGILEGMRALLNGAFRSPSKHIEKSVTSISGRLDELIERQKKLPEGDFFEFEALLEYGIANKMLTDQQIDYYISMARELAILPPDRMEAFSKKYGSKNTGGISPPSLSQ